MRSNMDKHNTRLESILVESRRLRRKTRSMKCTKNTHCPSILVFNKIDSFSNFSRHFIAKNSHFREVIRTSPSRSMMAAISRVDEKWLQSRSHEKFFSLLPVRTTVHFSMRLYRASKLIAEVKTNIRSKE